MQNPGTGRQMALHDSGTLFSPKTPPLSIYISRLQLNPEFALPDFFTMCAKMGYPGHIKESGDPVVSKATPLNEYILSTVEPGRRARILPMRGKGLCWWLGYEPAGSRF